MNNLPNKGDKIRITYENLGESLEKVVLESGQNNGRFTIEVQGGGSNIAIHQTKKGWETANGAAVKIEPVQETV